MPKRESPLVRLRRWLGWWCLIGGAAAIAVSLGFAMWIAVFVMRAAETSGKIVRMIPVENGETGTNYAPVFDFTASDGHTYTITSDTASNPPAYEAGDSVRVLYNPRTPSRARLKSTIQLWLFPLISGPSGAFYGLLGSVLLYFDRRYRRRVAVTTPTH